MTNDVTTYQPNSQLSYLETAVQTFEGIQKLAELMAKCGTMPAHLCGKPSDCFRIVVQAAKWRMDPFAVAECTALVHGKMCYEGKLIAAVLQSTGAIEGRLDYAIDGKGMEATIVVTGTPKGGKPVSIRGSVKEWRTTGANSPWDKQPETQLVYRGTRQWARVYAPEAILGVVSQDEMQEIRDVEHVVTATEVPEPKKAKSRKTAETVVMDTPPPAVISKEEIPVVGPKTNISKIDDLNRLAQKYLDLLPDANEGISAMRKINAALGLERMSDCPASSWDQYAIAIERLIEAHGPAAKAAQA